MELTSKKNVSLRELAENLEDMQNYKHDIVLHHNNISMLGTEIMTSEKNQLSDLFNGISNLEDEQVFYQVLPTAHAQIAEKLNIPKRYYDKLLKEQPDMLDYNVRELLNREPATYTLRTIKGKEDKNYLRAFLSDRYKVIDNLDILYSALEAIQITGKRVVLDSADLTDDKMIVRFKAPDVYVEAKELLQRYRPPKRASKNDDDYGITAGFVISNSETGKGTFTIAPRLIVNVCNNGMVFTTEQIKKIHLGAKQDEGKINWSVETKNKEMELIQSQVKDAVTAYLDEPYLNQVIADIHLKGRKELDYPANTISNIGLRLNLSEDKKKNLISYFMYGGDITTFGAINAVTYLAQELHPEERLELEYATSDLLTNISRYDIPTVRTNVSHFLN